MGYSVLELDACQVESLVVEYLPLVKQIVRGTCSRGVPTYIDADDLVQECALRLPQAIIGYQGRLGASMKTYLKTVIRRDVLDVIDRESCDPICGLRIGDDITACIEVESQDTESRNRAFKHAVAENSRAIADSNADPAAWSGDAGRLSDWRGRLTSEQAQVVELCHVNGMTQKQAAARLGVTREAVKSRLLKASLNLRKQRPSIKVNKFR